jgi:hypothetical protein
MNDVDRDKEAPEKQDAKIDHFDWVAGRRRRSRGNRPDHK